jgi:hypothetical protein
MAGSASKETSRWMGAVVAAASSSTRLQARRRKKLVGRCEVGRTIGQGAFAKVKFAVNTDTGAPVAMKVLDKATILNHRMLQQVASPPMSPRAAGIQVKFVLLPSPFQSPS